MTFSPYGWLMLAGIAVSAWVWSRTATRDPRLPLIYFAALVSALMGAKLTYLLAEGWIDLSRPDRWLRLATGKTILGGLFFGYLGVEIAKARLGFRQATGDWFAMVTPLGIGLGRLGCWWQGCCLGNRWEPAWYTVADSSGVQRWPSVPLEFAFNLAILPTVVLLNRAGRFPGQLFHLYLMSYGGLRFLHEFARDTPRILGPFSGYHFAALAVAGLGAFRYWQRANAHPARPSGSRAAPCSMNRIPMEGPCPSAPRPSRRADPRTRGWANRQNFLPPEQGPG